MVPLQSSIEAGHSEKGDVKPQKPKTLPCKYCSKRFRRVEHVQRHERTHTKEKPFACGWDRCGKRFGRRDLLVRHEKLVHLNDGTGIKDGASRAQNLCGGVRDAKPDMVAMAGCNLDLLSDAATQVALGADMGLQSALMPGLARTRTYGETMAYGDQATREHDMMTGAFGGQQQAVFDDYNLFLDDYATSSHFLPVSIEAEPPLRGGSKPPSTVPSRLPSAQPDQRDEMAETGPRIDENSIRLPKWRIAATDHEAIKNKLLQFSAVLPPGFVFPSRHTLAQFLDGYINGFHEHLPFLHMPTLVPAEVAPELLLAMLAVGAVYRFETNRGHGLWFAAKAVALEQIRRRHSDEVDALLASAAAYSPPLVRPSPKSGLAHVLTPSCPNRPWSRLETMQALLLLFSAGLWTAKAVLHEALSLQSTLALLVRQEGLGGQPNRASDWESWIRHEANTRTKLIAFCFFNLCSIAYNTPPLLLTFELDLYLPYPSRLWMAETAWQWQEARQSVVHHDMGLQDAFSRLLNRSPHGPLTPLTFLGNYMLMHALIQHIFLLKQTSFSSVSPLDVQRGLKADDVEEIYQALRLWTIGFEQHRHLRASECGQQVSAGLDNFSGGPIAFNSTALLRLAYIRLNTELSPSRSLETRDRHLVAGAFADAPLLVRTLRLSRAVVQAIHALSVVVKVGVSYVARTKSLEWSMQHSLCNLECAVLLSKWLVTLAAVGPADPPLSSEERNLLEMVRAMLDETDFAVPVDPSLAPHIMASPRAVDSAKLRRLAAAVVRLWAETFKGPHVFEIAKVMGDGLESYADLIENDRHTRGVPLLGRPGRA